MSAHEIWSELRQQGCAGDIRWSVGQIRGARELPVRILATA